MSKRRSSTRAPLDLTFFVDADLCGRPFLETLRAGGLPIVAHNDRFPEGTADEQWLRVAGEQGWIVLTHDKRIIKASFRVDALMQASTRVFTLIGDQHPNPTGERGHFLVGLAQNVLECRLAIERFLHRHRDPFIAKIYRSHVGDRPAARIRMVLRYEDWLKRAL